MDKIAIKATEITAQTEKTIADQKILTLIPINLSTKHSMATERMATSINKYSADAINELDTNLYKTAASAVKAKDTSVIGIISS